MHSTTLGYIFIDGLSMAHSESTYDEPRGSAWDCPLVRVLVSSVQQLPQFEDTVLLPEHGVGVVIEGQVADKAN